MLIQVGLDVARVWHGDFAGDVVGERVHHEGFAVFPATVDGGFVNAGAVGDALDAERGVADGSQLGQRRGQHGCANFRTAANRPPWPSGAYRNSKLRCGWRRVYVGCIAT